MIEFLRGTMSVCLFAVFGLGALAIAPLMFVLGRPVRGQPVVRALWVPLMRLFVATGLIAVDRGNLPRGPKGTLFVANHPSLIDVVLFVALTPRTLYIARHGLKSNPVLSAVVRATSLPDDTRLIDAAKAYLEKGWNVLIFPEGTRSPAVGGLHPFKRGAAQLALRTGAPVVCVGICPSYRILAKRQPIWDMGSQRVTYSFWSDGAQVESLRDGESQHAAACRVTKAFETRVRGLVR